LNLGTSISQCAQEFRRRYIKRILLKNSADNRLRMSAQYVHHQRSAELGQVLGADRVPGADRGHIERHIVFIVSAKEKGAGMTAMVDCRIRQGNRPVALNHRSLLRQCRQGGCYVSAPDQERR
jgi:hypothetical protein